MFSDVPEQLDCAIYIRVSTTKQVEEGYGLDLQKTDCEFLAKYRKWNVVDRYIDEGVSGTLDIAERPELKRLVEDAKNRKFKVVIVYAIDRLGRDSAIITGIIKILDANGISITSTKENIDSSTPQGKFVVDLFASLAEMDRKNVVNRMKKGRDELRKKKGWIGGIPPYGYKVINKEVLINEPEAKVVYYIYKLSRDGLNPNLIATTLNKHNLPSKMGTKWSRDAVKKILGREDSYRGGIINNNENNIRWPKIL